MTADEAALRILLSDKPEAAKQRQLTALAAQMKARLEGRVGCPECGHDGPHDSQRYDGAEEYCCAGCGMQFTER